MTLVLVFFHSFALFKLCWSLFCCALASSGSLRTALFLEQGSVLFRFLVISQRMPLAMQTPGLCIEFGEGFRACACCLAKAVVQTSTL